MSEPAPYKLFLGRPPKDAAWNALVEKSPHVIDNDEDEDRALLNDDKLPRGCTNWVNGEKYYCKMYIGGAQRHIAKGTLYQCAKFYDYALIFFDKYRVRKAVTKFNFDRADDETEMLLSSQIGEYFSALEKHLLDSGELAIPKDKTEARKEKQRERSYKRTIAGAIDAWREELQPHIFEIAEETKTALKAIETRLSAIESHLKIFP